MLHHTYICLIIIFKGKEEYIEMCLKLNAEAQMWKNHFEFRKLEQVKLEQKVNTLMTQLETVEGDLLAFFTAT